jgi:hypothetical protein
MERYGTVRLHTVQSSTAQCNTVKSRRLKGVCSYCCPPGQIHTPYSMQVGKDEVHSESNSNARKLSFKPPRPAK